MRLALIKDAYGIQHRTDCHHPRRIYRDRDRRWTCNGCGRRTPQSSGTPVTGTVKERTQP